MKDSMNSQTPKTFTTLWPIALCAVLLAFTFPAKAVVVGPYATDANTFFLFHLDEATGSTVATNASATTGFGTNALAFRNNVASTNPAASDNSILGAVSATGFTFGSFNNCAVITNLTGINGSGTVSNGLGKAARPREIYSRPGSRDGGPSAKGTFIILSSG